MGSIALKTYNGTQTIDLPSLKIQPARKLEPCDGYALASSHTVAVAIESQDLTTTGYGEASSIGVAEAKALSEALERFTFLSLASRGHRSLSSNGWACHPSEPIAKRLAACELVERNVALQTWFDSGPYYHVPESLWPVQVRAWMNQRDTKLEFSDLKILISSKNDGCCVTALLFNAHQNFVSGHASSVVLQDAIWSAVQECFRSVRLALRFNYFADARRLHLGQSGIYNPGVHGVAYAFEKGLPNGIIFEIATEDLVEEKWKLHQATLAALTEKSRFEVYEIAERFVAYAEFEEWPPMFWGPTPQNFDVSNKHPHIVG